MGEPGTVRLHLPLVPAVGDDEATPPTQEVSEPRRFDGGVVAEVDLGTAALSWEAPAHRAQGALAFAVQCDYGNVLGRRDVVARFQVRQLVQLEVGGYGPSLRAERVAAAHGNG